MSQKSESFLLLTCLFRPRPLIVQRFQRGQDRNHGGNAKPHTVLCNFGRYRKEACVSMHWSCDVCINVDVLSYVNRFAQVEQEICRAFRVAKCICLVRNLPSDRSDLGKPFLMKQNSNTVVPMA